MKTKKTIKVSKEDQVVIDAQVAKVKADIEAAYAKRVADGVVETKEETLVRETAEAEALKNAEAGIVVSEDEQFHLDARDARVKVVKDAIEAARVLRVTNEEAGTVETDGAKLDREAKEVKDLAEANVVNVIEPFEVDVNNIEIQKIADKVSEIITFLNK